MLRVVITSFALLALPPAARAEVPLTAFAKQVAGVWSRLPSPPLQPFPAADLEAGLRKCSPPAGRFIRFAARQGKLALLRTGKPVVAVLRAEKGPARNGFDSWAVATNEGALMMLVRKGGRLSLLMTEEGSYVRCPTGDASGGEVPSGSAEPSQP